MSTRTKLIRSAAALGLLGAALLGWLPWIIFLAIVAGIALGLAVLTAEAVRPLIRAQRQRQVPGDLVDADPSGWGFDYGSRLD